MISFIILNPSSWCAISRPRKKIKIFTLSPSARKARIFLSLISRSPLPIFKPMRICLMSLDLAFLRFFCCSFIFWYWYLPQSMTFATGGAAPGLISTRSRFAARAASSASARVKIPSCSPFSPITRSSVAEIASLMRIDLLMRSSFHLNLIFSAGAYVELLYRNPRCVSNQIILSILAENALEFKG